MAHANNSIITGKFKWSPGKQLVFREREGKTAVAKSPKGRSGDPTTAQAEIQESRKRKRAESGFPLSLSTFLFQNIYKKTISMDKSARKTQLNGLKGCRAGSQSRCDEVRPATFHFIEHCWRPCGN